MENVQREVEEILEQYVRPGLRQHGGGIRLLEVKNGAAYIKFTGHCSGCPSAIYDGRPGKGRTHEAYRSHTGGEAAGRSQP